MSNEYKDWLRDSAEEEKIYPYLKISSDGNSWMDYIPTGWQNRIYKLFDNINTILGDRINYFHILDIKEKYGEFRLYWTIDDGMATNAEKEQIEELAQQARFDLLSACILCGDHAKYKYINVPVCEECDNNLFKRRKEK